MIESMKPYSNTYTLDTTDKEIYSIERRGYYITVTRDCFDIDVVKYGKASYQKRSTCSKKINRRYLKTLPVYRIYYTKKCYSKTKRILRPLFSLARFLYNGKFFLYLKKLNDPLPYANFLKENPTKVRLTGENYRRTLKRLFGRGMDSTFRLGTIKKLTKISKYDLGKIMSVIRHDYYKLVGQYR